MMFKITVKDAHWMIYELWRLVIFINYPLKVIFELR